jgi:pyrroloquinoline quinone biosynthesis protein B
LVSIIARRTSGCSAPPPAAASRSGTAAARHARPPAPEPPHFPGRSRRSRSAGPDGPWFLANASPDLRQQLEGLAADAANGVRAAPVAGVLLTDAEIDHTAGLLLLRESSTAIRVYGSEEVRRALTDGYPVLPILAGYCGVEWRTLDPQGSLAIDGSSLEVESFAAGGDAPRYLAGTGADVEATGLVFRDRSTGGVMTYVPGLARLDDDVLGRLAASDVVLVDGTFWRDDELAGLGISDHSASQMGHVPLSGPGGTLEGARTAQALAGDPRPHQQHEPGAARALARA